MPSRKIIAVFDSQAHAQRAREELMGLGIKDDEIQIVDKSGDTFATRNADGDRGTFWSHIKEWFMPDEDRATIDESIRRGGFVLSASVPDQYADEAIACLERSGAVDLEQRESEWRAAGWGGTTTDTSRTPAAGPTAADTSPAVGDREDSGALPVVEERLRVGKREVNRGSVRARSYIVEEPVHEQVRLREEHVDIERRPVDAPTRPVAGGATGDLLQERSIEMTETAEQAVVSKEAVVTEEVRLKKTTDERVEDIHETVRHTEVDVEDGRKGERSSRPRDRTAPPPPRR